MKKITALLLIVTLAFLSACTSPIENLIKKEKLDDSMAEYISIDEKTFFIDNFGIHIAGDYSDGKLYINNELTVEYLLEDDGFVWFPIQREYYPMDELFDINIVATNASDGSSDYIKFHNVYSSMTLNMDELGEIEEAEHLILGGEAITGSIENLAALNNLKGLYFLPGYYDPPFTEAVCLTVPRFELAQIAGMNSLKYLTLMDFSQSITGTLSQLDDMSNLEALYFEVDYMISEIAELKTHDNLKLLYVNGLELECEDCSSLSQIAGLEYLMLTGFKSEINMDEIRDFKNLKYLSFSGEGTGSLKQIAALDSLTHLVMNGEFDSSGKIADLSGMKSLEYLSIRGKGLDGNITNFKDIDSLKYLTLGGDSLYGNIGRLGVFKNLEHLYAHYDSLNAGNIAGLYSLDNLVELTLACNNVEGNFSSLGKLESLQKLSLIDCYLIKGNIDSLQSQSIKELALAGCTGIQGDIGKIDGLPNLQLLRVYDCFHVEGDIAGLINNESLETVHISSCYNVEGNISDLKAMKSLKYLVVSDCRNVKGTLYVEGQGRVKAD